MTLKSFLRRDLSKVLLATVAVAAVTRKSSADGVTLPSLPLETQSQFARLPSDAQAVALRQLSRMGNYDQFHTMLDPTGHFLFFEDKQIAQTDLADSPPETMSLADIGPSGFTPEGVPIFHTLRGSRYVIYLNFLGGNISGTAWNTYGGAPMYDALPYMLDSDRAFSTTEQTMMGNIWRRVAEDFAPWQIDVTTERPATMTSTTTNAMITSHMSASGLAMPAPNAGGVAYLDIFGYSDFAYYSPAFVYYDNLMRGREDVVAEATTHEVGHNFGLSHDGIAGGSPYYGGAGSGVTSWGAIMGASYFRSVTHFNNGDYAGANNHEDDLGIITGHTPLRTDDVPNATSGAAVIVPSNGSFNRAGMIEWYNDVDMYSIDSLTAIAVTAKPYTSSINTTGNNVDLAIELLNSTGARVAFSSPNDSSAASISVSGLSGKYYIKVYPVGNPVTPYSVYGSMGRYDLLGTATITNVPNPPDPPNPPNPGVVIFQESMVNYPSGWTVNMSGAAWHYGRPSSSLDPRGFSVVGNVISGSGFYPEPIANSQQLISKSFSTVGYKSVAVSFDRFLGVQADDVVSVHVCEPGAGCVTLWTNSGAVNDTTWKNVVYTLPPEKWGKPRITIRFGLGPVQKAANGSSSSSFGWNIKQLIVTGIKQ